MSLFSDIRRIADALDRIAPVSSEQPTTTPELDGISYHDPDYTARLDALDRLKKLGMLPEDARLPEDDQSTPTP